MKICEYCKKEIIGRTDKKTKYCSKECFHSARRKAVVCKICHKEFFVARAVTRLYCSKECRIKDNWSQIADKSKKKVFTCKWCGKQFETWAYRKPTMCSRQCTSEYGAHQLKPDARKPENFITKQCEICGSDYKVHKCQDERKKYKSRYCSRKCLYEKMSIETRGNNNPRWRGGSLSQREYGKHWFVIRNAVRERDEYSCKMCGRKNRRLDVHHIIKLRFYNGDTDRANDLSNLITVCVPCHKKLDAGLF